MSRLTLTAAILRRPLLRPFVISTGARTHQPVLSVQLTDGPCSGRGEATGLAYLGDTPEGLLEQVEAVRTSIEAGITRDELIDLLPAGGARSALDAALWELDAARGGRSVQSLLDLTPKPITSAFTIGLDTPEAMAARTLEENWRPLLKVKLGGADEEDGARLRAVADASGSARLVADINAGWTTDRLAALAPVAAEGGYELLEQPLAAGQEDGVDARAAIQAAARYLPICADESFQTLDDLDRIAATFQAVNIKLDKCGGLTSALRIRDAAREKGLKIFVGCMLAPTVAIAPAHLLAQDADYADLDGPFWFPDEPAHLTEGGLFEPIDPAVWGRGEIRAND